MSVLAKFATAEFVEHRGGLQWCRRSVAAVPTESSGLAGDTGTGQHTAGLRFPLGLDDMEMKVLGV